MKFLYKKVANFLLYKTHYSAAAVEEHKLVQ